MIKKEQEATSKTNDQKNHGLCDPAGQRKSKRKVQARSKIQKVTLWATRLVKDRVKGKLQARQSIEKLSFGQPGVT